MNKCQKEIYEEKIGRVKSGVITVDGAIKDAMLEAVRWNDRAWEHEISTQIMIAKAKKQSDAVIILEKILALRNKK